jgi:RNA polymerase sigma-70 factor (ECF subfamily)
MQAADDRDLLAATARGDSDAFACFFRRHEARVTAFCIRRCAGPDEVADAVADTFLIALRRAGAYEPSLDTALPWLVGIAQRVVHRQERGRRRRGRLHRRVAGASGAYTDDEAERIIAAIDAARRSDDLRDVLAELPRGERRILELVAYADLTPAEAASALGISANAARLRLARARRRVRHAEEPDSEVASASA